MIRVLHVLETERDFETQRCVEHLAHDLGGGFEAEVRTIGPGGHWRGLAEAVRGLRGKIEFDLVHTWSGRALTAAALSGRLPIVHSTGPLVTRKALGWLRAVLAHRAVQITCPTATAQRVLLSGGIAPDHCHLIRPGVQFGRVRRRGDSELRAALGLAEEDCVLLAIGESTRAANHRDALWAGSILHELDARCRLLVWGRGPEIDAVVRFNQRLINPQLLVIAERRLGRPVAFEELLPVADLAVLSPIGAVSTLPISLCMAGGVPMVASATSTVSELLEDHHTALLTPRRAPQNLARTLLRLREDKDLCWRLSDRARTEAYDYFALSHFLNPWRTFYRQYAAGQAIQLPEVAQGTGARFAQLSR